MTGERLRLVATMPGCGNRPRRSQRVILAPPWIDSAPSLSLSRSVMLEVSVLVPASGKSPLGARWRSSRSALVLIDGGTRPRPPAFHVLWDRDQHPPGAVLP